MQYLKNLISSKSYFDRVPEQSLIADNGEKYNNVLATRGKQYAMLYSYNCRAFTVAIDKLDSTPQKASWFNPRDGDKTTIKDFNNKPNKTFDPPGEKRNGMDWVLILEK